jgi:hypothetical protein
VKNNKSNMLKFEHWNNSRRGKSKQIHLYNIMSYGIISGATHLTVSIFLKYKIKNKNYWMWK